MSTALETWLKRWICCRYLHSCTMVHAHRISNRFRQYNYVFQTSMRPWLDSYGVEDASYSRVPFGSLLVRNCVAFWYIANVVRRTSVSRSLFKFTQLILLQEQNPDSMFFDPMLFAVRD